MAKPLTAAKVKINIMKNENTETKPSGKPSDASTCSSVILTIEAHRVPIGERVQVGDWWHYRAIGRFFQIEKPRRNWLGLRQKITRHHATHYRLMRVLKTNSKRCHGEAVDIRKS